MTKFGFSPLLLLFLVSTAHGQKVKYKDIFPLLETRQYEQAEPFLKQYLATNTSNPNAYLYMGNILREKALKDDILRETDIAIANMDSAIYFYERAYKTLDDREIRRNKGYYQAYNRRDLRTGQFGVKLSDIQFDIEKKIEGLKERTEQVKSIKQSWTTARDSYLRAQAIYVDLQKQYASLNQLALRSDDSTIETLERLALKFDSCVQAFDDYKSASVALEKSGYKPERTIIGIKDFSADGQTTADFLNDEVALWDYKSFAESTRQTIVKEIIPMRKNLIDYDAEISALKEKFARDSASVRSDLMALIDRMLDDQLRKFDDTPLPSWIFALKTTQLEYLSAGVDHQPLRDSANVLFQVDLVQSEVQLLQKMDSVLAILPESDIRAKADDYAAFVQNRYDNADGVVAFAREMTDFIAIEREKKSAELAWHIKALNYIVDAGDSIPLTDEVVSAYKPLLVSLEEYTVGISLKDSTALEGYFYTITPSRLPDVKAFFKLHSITVDNVTASGALVQSDPAGQLFYVLIYAEEPAAGSAGDRFSATLAKIYRSDGMAWHKGFALTFMPSELLLSPSSGEVVISNGEEEVVVDKNGEAVR